MYITKYRMSQKGFMIAPVLVWVLLTVSGLFVGTVAVKEGLIAIDLSGIQSQGEVKSDTTDTTILDNLQFPTPTPSYTPTPTLKTSPQGQVQGVTQTNQNLAPKHDGSRTGRIVKYHSLCEGKDISVYENELVPYKRITGETIYTTKGDIKCYEDQINQLKNEALGTQNIPYQPSTPSEPTITCVLSYGTYQLTQASCDSFKASDKPYTPPQYYSCTICYPYSPESCLTYNYLYKTKEECDAEQQRTNQYGGNPPQPTADPAIVQYFNEEFQKYTREQQDQQCKQVVQSWEDKQAELRNKKYSSSFDQAREFIYWQDQYYQMRRSSCGY